MTRYAYTYTYTHGTRDPQVVGGVNLVSFVTPRVVPRTFYSRNKFEHFDEKKKEFPQGKLKGLTENHSAKKRKVSQNQVFLFPNTF